MKKMVYLLAIISLMTGLSLTACGGSERLSQSGENNTGVVQAAESQATVGDSAAGQKLFAGTCSACHGPAGEGLPGLGKDMTTSEFIAGKSDEELVAFLKVGRDPSDPLNTTGVAMPPKGGNPALSDEDLYHLIAYIRTIHKQ
ncbi:MAG: cytochrome c [Anaerolineae bacterium]|nr:cytochrome c [Anaerolineae bacterium]